MEMMTWEVLDDWGFLKWEQYQPNSLILKSVAGSWKDVTEETYAEHLIPGNPWQLYKTDICYRNVLGVWYKYTRQPVAFDGGGVDEQ
ncbi:MAG: hypothetical protein GY759_08725 [Chloroflexi bacterium]|nr:hypothetical protein [Chloroflexota bacterium]MCP4846413.1 hypothetical protein [Verrucomicrobiaceae bacterium]